MVNKNILFSKLTDKFNRLALHGIVNECFINGLPIANENIDRDEKIALTKYSYKVLDKLGGFSVLESAIENNSLTLNQKLLLGDIYNICTEASKEAATRIVKETDCDAPDTKIDEVMDKAAFTKAEYNKFAKGANNVGIDEISKIIKNKTLAVIKDEQEQYEKEEILANELKDALAETKDFSDTTTESYMDIILNKSDARHHISLFSKLQESAMEMMNICKVGKSGEDVIPIVEKVTFESFLDSLRSDDKEYDTWMESFNEVANEEISSVPDENKPKMATLTSIIVYTVIETLKTLNLYNPNIGEVKKFVNSNISGEKIANEDINKLYKKAEESVLSAKKLDFSKMDSKTLADKSVEFKKISELVQESVTNGGSTEKSVPLVSALEGYVESINDVLNARNVERKAMESTTDGYYDKINRSHDLSQFNKINNLFGKNPLVKEIRLQMNPDGVDSIIDVACANESGQIIKSSFINMQYACESSNYLDYIKDTFKQSNLAECDKDVSIILKDGKGTKINLS